MPAAGTALGALRTRVRINLNQTSAPSDTTQQWQNTDINQYINDTIVEITPEISIEDQVSSGYLTVSADYIYGISATNFYRLHNVEIWNTGNSAKLFRYDNWSTHNISGKLNLVLRDPFPGTDYVIRMWGSKRIPNLSADGVSSEVAAEIDQVIVLGATAKAFRSMMADRIQFSRYMTKIQQQEGKTRDILLAGREFESQYREQLARLTKPGGNFLSFIGNE